MRRRAPQLGELERTVLACLWSEGPADVKAMHAAVGGPRGIRPNTVQSTLERLHRKGLAGREKVGRAFVYRARVSEREWVQRSLEAVLDGFPGDRTGLILSSFVDLAERTDADLLAELERWVRARRRTLRARGSGEGDA